MTMTGVVVLLMFLLFFAFCQEEWHDYYNCHCCTQRIVFLMEGLLKHLWVKLFLPMHYFLLVSRTFNERIVLKFFKCLHMVSGWFAIRVKGFETPHSLPSCVKNVEQKCESLIQFTGGQTLMGESFCKKISFFQSDKYRYVRDRYCSQSH
jgi:hypothetical protein